MAFWVCDSACCSWTRVLRRRRGDHLFVLVEFFAVACDDVDTAHRTVAHQQCPTKYPDTAAMTVGAATAATLTAIIPATPPAAPPSILRSHQRGLLSGLASIAAKGLGDVPGEAGRNGDKPLGRCRTVFHDIGCSLSSGIDHSRAQVNSVIGQIRAGFQYGLPLRLYLGQSFSVSLLAQIDYCADYEGYSQDREYSPFNHDGRTMPSF